MKFFFAVIALLFASPAIAQAQLAPELSGLSFLVGKWGNGAGHVSDTNGPSTGSSVITIEANGAALLRRDHTDLLGKDGKIDRGFDQMMLIYSESGGVRADFVDGERHVIHYTRATIASGKSVLFEVEAGKGPDFKLKYELSGPNELTITFGMQRPEGFAPIAVGTLKRTN